MFLSEKWRMLVVRLLTAFRILEKGLDSIGEVTELTDSESDTFV